MHWIAQAGWKPGTFDQWGRHPRYDPDDCEFVNIGRDTSTDAIALRQYKEDLTFNLWGLASHHHSGDGLQQGPPSFRPPRRDTKPGRAAASQTAVSQFTTV